MVSGRVVRVSEEVGRCVIAGVVSGQEGREIADPESETGPGSR